MPFLMAYFSIQLAMTTAPTYERCPSAQRAMMQKNKKRRAKDEAALGKTWVPGQKGQGGEGSATATVVVPAKAPVPLAQKATSGRNRRSKRRSTATRSLAHHCRRARGSPRFCAEFWI